MDKSTVVVKKYQLGRNNGAYDSNVKTKLLRERMMMPRKLAEENNQFKFIDSGKWYEIDEDATEERFKELEDQKIKKEANKVLESNAIADALKMLISQTQAEPKEEKKTKGRKPKSE